MKFTLAVELQPDRRNTKQGGAAGFMLGIEVNGNLELSSRLGSNVGKGKSGVRGVPGSVQDLEVVVVSPVMAKRGWRRVSSQHVKLEERLEIGPVASLRMCVDGDISSSVSVR